MSNDITAPGRSALWTQAALNALMGAAAPTIVSDNEGEEEFDLDHDAFCKTFRFSVITLAHRSNVLRELSVRNFPCIKIAKNSAAPRSNFFRRFFGSTQPLL